MEELYNGGFIGNSSPLNNILWVLLLEGAVRPLKGYSSLIVYMDSTLDVHAPHECKTRFFWLAMSVGAEAVAWMTLPQEHKGWSGPSCFSACGSEMESLQYSIPCIM